MPSSPSPFRDAPPPSGRTGDSGSDSPGSSTEGSGGDDGPPSDDEEAAALERAMERAHGPRRPGAKQGFAWADLGSETV